MAKILLCTMSLPGRVDPVLVISRELARRGHEVWWYTGKRFQAKIEATGAHHVPLDESLDFDDKNLDEVFPDRKNQKGFNLLKHDIKHLVIDTALGQMQDLVNIMDEFSADVILADTVAASGVASLYDKGGPPWAALGTSPIPFGSRDTAPFGMAMMPNPSSLGRLRNRFLYWMLNNFLFRDVARYADNARAQVNLPPLEVSIWDVPLSPFLYMACTSPLAEYTRSDLPPQVHFVGPLFPPPSSKPFEPPAWWDELQTDRPVILVTQGTISNDPVSLVAPSVRALANENVLVVVTTGGYPTDQIGVDPLPANVRVEEFIPYHDLLPHIDVMITNGGYGGIQMAHAHGIPLIVAGATEEKPEICNRVAWSGAGIKLKTHTPTPEQVGAAFKEITTNPRYKQKAEQIKADCARYNAPIQIVDLLELLIQTKKPVLNGQKAG